MLLQIVIRVSIGRATRPFKHFAGWYKSILSIWSSSNSRFRAAKRSSWICATTYAFGELPLNFLNCIKQPKRGDLQSFEAYLRIGRTHAINTCLNMRVIRDAKHYNITPIQCSYNNILPYTYNRKESAYSMIPISIITRHFYHSTFSVISQKAVRKAVSKSSLKN